MLEVEPCQDPPWATGHCEPPKPDMVIVQGPATCHTLWGRHKVPIVLAHKAAVVMGCKFVFCSMNLSELQREQWYFQSYQPIGASPRQLESGDYNRMGRCAQLTVLNECPAQPPFKLIHPLIISGEPKLNPSDETP